MRDEINDPAAPPGLFVINRDGTGERRIGEGRRADWSPDGKSIVFATGGRRGPWGGSRILSRVYIARADGTGREEIADGDAPTWSPDGKRIACIQQDPAYEAPVIRVIDLETGRQRLLGFGWFRANWSSDSRSVVCNCFVDEGKDGMGRYSAEEPGRPEPLLPEEKNGLAPCYSRDGKVIVFIARRRDR
jgi:Tol biopolymer transport system component